MLFFGGRIEGVGEEFSSWAFCSDGMMKTLAVFPKLTISDYISFISLESLLERVSFTSCKSDLENMLFLIFYYYWSSAIDSVLFSSVITI